MAIPDHVELTTAATGLHSDPLLIISVWMCIECAPYPGFGLRETSSK